MPSFYFSLFAFLGSLLWLAYGAFSRDIIIMVIGDKWYNLSKSLIYDKWFYWFQCSSYLVGTKLCWSAIGVWLDGFTLDLQRQNEPACWKCKGGYKRVAGIDQRKCERGHKRSLWWRYWNCYFRCIIIIVTSQLKICISNSFRKFPICLLVCCTKSNNLI